MSVIAFEGPAGTGKTHRLIEELEGMLTHHPPAAHQRVLALTFMHGARRRLDSRLRQVKGLGRQYDATTLDSFAWRLARRWRRLAVHLGYAMPGEEQYDETCKLVAALLARPAVRSWVAVSYPVVLVDEAQDLSLERSTMIEGIAASSDVLLAFDEFQCLNPGLRPMAINAWLPGRCVPTSLSRCRRTSDAELLEAAHALREGRALNAGGKRFKIIPTPGKPDFAATYLANAIAWRAGRSVALLTPSRSGGFADSVVDLVRSRALGKRGNGPYPIEWENSETEERASLWKDLDLPECCTVSEALSILEPYRDSPAIKAAKEWIARQRSVHGIEVIGAEDVKRQIGRVLAARRRFAAGPSAAYVAMTIQQAKNREFDDVVVIWPYTVATGDDQRRRLLYNAITRARRQCSVLVQGQKLLEGPPFAV